MKPYEIFCTCLSGKTICNCMGESISPSNNSLVHTPTDMKAEKAIEIQFDSEFWNPDDEDFKNKIIQAMRAYAKDQIQKDRERVKKEYYNETNSSDFNEMIKNTPIILD